MGESNESQLKEIDNNNVRIEKEQAMPTLGELNDRYPGDGER